MLICGLTYATIGAAGLLVFGQGVKGDVLANLNIDDVADILGGRLQLAMAFVASVKVRKHAMHGTMGVRRSYRMLLGCFECFCLCC